MSFWILISMILCGLLTIVFLFFGSYWGALVFLGFTIYFVLGFKKIPSDPPHVGLVTFWGERTGETKDEGITLLAPYFPFFYDVQQIKVVKVNEDIPFTNVRCVVSEDEEGNVEDTDKKKQTNQKTSVRGTKIPQKKIKSGGSVTVVVSITWIPDKETLISYTTSGREKGVKTILSDKMADVIRQMGRTHTWEEMTFATDVMTANLILEITKLDENEKLLSPEWKTAAKRLKENLDEENLILATNILKKMLVNGIADSHDLGIKIQRLNIKQVEPEGELKKDAEESAREVQQRRAEDFELRTETRQAEILYKLYKKNKVKDKTLEDCVLEIRRRKQIKAGKGQVYDISGIPSNIFSFFNKGGGK